MLNFEKPIYKITDYIEKNSYGKFELEPLERGFGTTLGNSLRRVMLSSMPGSAIVAVKIDGAMHEFQALDGVAEDVMSIILNLKGVVVKNHSNEELKFAKVLVDSEQAVTAGDIEVDSDIEIVNKNHVIANVAKGGKLDMEIVIANGRGYVQSEENRKYLENAKIGFIPIDANFSPVERVDYDVEMARVGQDANYDKLVLNVYTKGSMRPEEAVSLSSKILIEHLKILTELSEIADSTGVMSAKQEDTKQKKLEISIDDLELSVRALNCLKRADVNTLGELVEKTEKEVSEIKNLGKKSQQEIIDIVKEQGLKFHDDKE